MRNCHRVKGFKPFFKIDYKDIMLGQPIFSNNILSVLDNQGNKLPLIAKIMKMDTVKNKKDITSEVDIQSFAGLHNIAPKIYDFFICRYQGNDYYTFLMELVEGVTLDEFIDQKGSFPDNLKKAIKIQLDKLYDLGIRHDDMHGGNFIITRTGDIMIIDFGDVKLYRGKVPHTERAYTIQINLSDWGDVTIAKEDPRVEEINKERLAKMKRAVNEAKIRAIQNEIIGLQKFVDKYRMKGNDMMAGVYEKQIKQREDLLRKFY